MQLEQVYDFILSLFIYISIYAYFWKIKNKNAASKDMNLHSEMLLFSFILKGICFTHAK